MTFYFFEMYYSVQLNVLWSVQRLPDMEVLYIDIPVGGSLSLTPKKETLLGRCFWGKSEFTVIALSES